MLSGLIVFLLIRINLFPQKKRFSRERIFPIESGFLSFNKRSFFFNLSFYIILLLFVLFDIEVIFVLFFPVLKNFSFFPVLFISFFIFITLWLE